jgi:hypothetical protein
MSLAGFTINGTPSTNRGYDAARGEVLSLALENPSSVVSAVFTVLSTTEGAGSLTFSAASPVPLSASVNATVPTTVEGGGDWEPHVGHSFAIQCSVTYQDERGNHRTDVFTRIVAVRSARGLRKILPVETIEYSAASWVTGLNEMVDATSASRSFLPSATDSAANTAEIKARLDLGEQVVLFGDCYVDDPFLVTTSGGGIIGSPEVGGRLIQSANWSGTGVHDVENAFIRLVETEAGTAATTPSAAETPMFWPTIALTSATGFTAGRYFKSLGGSGTSGNDYGGQSAGPNRVTEELLQVDSETGGTVTHRITMTRHVGQNNSVSPYKQFKLLDGAVDGFTLKNITLDAYANRGSAPVVACGLSASFARRVVIEDVKVKGFTYAGIHGRGSKDWFVRMRNVGATNCRWHFFSCQNIDIESHDVLEVYERQNTQGGGHGRHYAWKWESQCHNIRARGTIEHAVAGVLAWGGDFCDLDFSAQDIRFQVIGTHAPGIDEDVGGGRRGYVLDTGANDVPTAEFGRRNRYKARWSNCHSGTAKYWPDGSDVPQHWYGAVYMHDVFDCEADLFNSDYASDPTTATERRWAGLISQDSYGMMRLNLRGFVKGTVWIGTLNNWHIEQYEFFPGSGNGNTGYNITGDEVAIVLDEGSGGLPRFYSVKQLAGYHLVDFYSSFAFPLLAGSRNTLISHCPMGAVIYNSNQYEAREIRIGRMANSTAYAGLCRAHPIDDAAASDGELRVNFATAAAPTTGTFITLTINHNNCGVLRPVIGVLGGIEAVVPIYLAASTTVGAREFLEADANGFAIAAANGANDLATLKRIIGRPRYKRVTGGSPDFMQMGC